MGVLRLGEEACIGGQAALFYCTVQVEQGLAHIIHLPQVSQVSGMAQGGHFIKQGVQCVTLTWLLLPARQHRLGIEQNVHGLGQETGDQLRVALAAPRVLRVVMQAGQAAVHCLANLLDQLRSAGYGSQRRTVKLRQAQMKQRARGFQPFHLGHLQRQLMPLVLTGQAVEGGGEFGDRHHPGHGGTAFERVQGTLQAIADRRIVTIGALQEGIEAGQVALRFTAENIQ